MTAIDIQMLDALMEDMAKQCRLHNPSLRIWLNRHQPPRYIIADSTVIIARAATLADAISQAANRSY